MGSFTDIIPKFNPYVQQLPVEAMVKVGMAKQQAYEQNVTKIQSEIDNIAGLDIMRDVDRNYLQSKLNELGNNLTKFAAADYSNFQLTNAVGGMTKQIVKDDTIKTAVSSTAWARKQKEKIEKGKSDGTWAVENEDLYNTQLGNWLKGSTAGEAFNSEYIPYRDVYKKLKEIAKEVGIDETLVQNMFDANGKPNMYMIETMTKGKDANKILNAFMNGLDQSDFRQLSISGIYKYKNYSPSELVPILENSNSTFVTLANDRRLQILEKLKDLEIKKVGAPAALKPQIDQEISNLNTQIANIDTQIEEGNTTLNEYTQKLLSGDESFADQMKAKLYSTQFLNQMSASFASKDSYIKFLKSPLWESIMDEKKFNLDSWYKNEQIKIDKSELQIEKDKLAAEKEKILLEKMKLGIVPLPGGISGDIDLPGVVNEQYNSAISERGELLKQTAIDYLVEINRSKGLTREQVMENVKVWARKANASKPNPSAEEEKKLVDDWLESFGARRFAQIKTTLNTTPENIQRNEIIDQYNNQIQRFKNGIEFADQQAANLSGFSNADVSNFIKGAQPQTFDVYGKKITLQPNEILDLVKYTKSKRSLMVSKKDQLEANQAYNRLSKKYTPEQISGMYNYSLSEISNQPGFINDFVFGSPVKYITDKFMGKKPNLSTIQMANSFLDGAQFSQYRDNQKKTYGEVFSAFYPMKQPLVMSGEGKGVTVRNITNIFSDRPELAKVKKLLDQENTQASVFEVPSVTGFGKNTYELRVIGKEGESESFIINEREYTDLTGKTPETVNTNFNLMRISINSSPDKSSNPKGLGSVTTMQFGKGSFTNLKNSDYNIIGGDYIMDKSNPNIFFPYIYVEDNNGNVTPIPTHDPLSLPDAMTFPSRLTEAKLKSILKK